MKVPFLDLKAQHKSIKEEINDAIQEVALLQADRSLKNSKRSSLNFVSVNLA